MGSCNSCNMENYDKNKLSNRESHQISDINNKPKKFKHSTHCVNLLKPLVLSRGNSENLRGDSQIMRPYSDRNPLNSNPSRKQRFDYCNQFQHQNQNRNYLLRHLANSLNRDLLPTSNDAHPSFKKNKYVEWEYKPNPQTNVTFWKANSRIELTQDNIDQITSMPKEQILNQSFLKKRIWIENKLHSLLDQKDANRNSDRQNPILLISRGNILEESFNQFMTTKEFDFLKQIQIHFIDEVARDIGGVFQEWYTCLMKEFLVSSHNLFNTNNYSSSISITSNSALKDNILYYEFFGKLLGKGLLDEIILPFNLNFILLKQILNLPLELEDMKHFDNDLYQSLLSLREKEITIENELYFVWNIRGINGNIEQVNLIPEGSSVNISDNNKELFISKVIEYECYLKQKEQIDYVVNGFKQLIPIEYISILTPEEFDFVFSGQKSIDINDWHSNTVYKGEYYSNHATIKLFWDIMGELTQEDLMTFFHFCTGRPKVPIDGFATLMGPHNQLQKFTIDSAIQKSNDSFRLIEAKTCFNRIYLPNYLTKEEMKKAILTIINHDTNFFGLE